MKKRILFGILLLSSSLLQAAPDNFRDEYRFKRHWQLQLQGGIGYTLGEAGFNDLLSPSAALSAVYRFSPIWGLRGGFSGWQAKGSWAAPSHQYKYNFVQLNVDAIFDIANCLGSFNHRRFFNPYLFLGIAGNYAFHNDEAGELHQAGYPLQYLWEDSRFFVAGRGGLGIDFRLSNGVSFNLEGNANMMSDHFNSKKAGNADWHFNLMAGFTFRLGKGYTKKEKAVPQETTPAAPITTSQPEPVKEKTPEAPVKAEKAEPIRENIFFALNSSKLRASEEPKIDILIAYLKKHTDSRIILTGYADKQTGNARINSRLSQQRAQKVADALIAAGIPESSITIDYKGDSVQPFGTPEENRVTICITEIR